MAGPSSATPADSRVSVSHVVADPIWSLRPWSVNVNIGPLLGAIPAQPAADWLVILMQDDIDLFDVVPGMCGPTFEEQVTDSLLLGRIELSQIRRAALDVISSVTGRPWWFSMRLIKTAVASWEVIGGELAIRGVDAERLSISAWLDASLLICLRSIESNKITMFMSQLEIAPPEEGADQEESMTMSADTFMSLSAQ